MTDHLSPAGRSRNMAAIRSKNTAPERALRHELRRIGVMGYRLHARLPGRPDVAFTRWKIAVFTDGAFWHGHPDHLRPDASDYWRGKIARTKERDRAADEQLVAAGWRVIRVWDFEVLTAPGRVARLVADALAEAGRPSRSGPQAGLQALMGHHTHVVLHPPLLVRDLEASAASAAPSPACSPRRPKSWYGTLL